MAKGRLRKVLSHARLNWQIIRYRLARWRNDLLLFNPWMLAFWPLSFLTGVALSIWFSFKDRLPPKYVELEPLILSTFGGFCLVAYFIIAAVAAWLLLARERGYNDDKRSFNSVAGALFNGLEPSISMRVATLTSVLGHLKSELGDPLDLALYVAGTEAANDFGQQLPLIYERDIRGRRGLPGWDRLSFEEKVREWLRYDSENGWGQLSPTFSSPGQAPQGQDPTVTIRILHSYGLVAGVGGRAFAQLMAGYCETVLSAILAAHTLGVWGEYMNAEYRIARIEHKADVDVPVLIFDITARARDRSAAEATTQASASS